jgi:large repetitive protein
LKAASAAPFTIAGLDAEDTGTVTFTDANNQSVAVSVNGGQSNYTADLTTLADGPISSSLQVNTDPAGNSFGSVAGNSVTLDQDAGEQAALSLTVGNTDIGLKAASAAPFTIAGLDAEDTGTVTFTDANNQSVAVSVNGGQTSYTADLTSLADGPISSSLQVNTDPAGNSFGSVAGNSVTLDTDKNVSPVVSFIGPIIDAAADKAWPVTISGLDDEAGNLTFTDASGHSASVEVGGNGTYLANLSSLSDGPITSMLSVSDPVGNHWSMIGGDLTLVGTEVAGSNYVQLSGLSTGNLGRLGPNGPTVIDAAQTHGVTFRSGNGPDTIVAGTNDTVYAGNGPDTLVGASGTTLHAGNGPQTLYGAPGETMIGGNGPDTFVFEPGFGQDTVADFHTNKDVLQFNPSMLINFAAAMADAKQVGANTVFTIDPNNSVTLQNVNMNNLTASNFHFS